MTLLYCKTSCFVGCRLFTNDTVWLEDALSVWWSMFTGYCITLGLDWLCSQLICDVKWLLPTFRHTTTCHCVAELCLVCLIKVCNEKTQQFYRRVVSGLLSHPEVKPGPNAYDTRPKRPKRVGFSIRSRTIPTYPASINGIGMYPGVRGTGQCLIVCGVCYTWVVFLLDGVQCLLLLGSVRPYLCAVFVTPV